jgi:hypothetical protein
MTVKRLLALAALAFIAWWIIADPHGAAAFFHQAGAWLRHAGTSLAAFISDL